MSVRIPIYGRREGRNGQVIGHTLVSDEDAYLAEYRWNLVSHGYVAARVDDTGRREAMHRIIAGLTPGDGLEVDHRNRDKLDNRRENLRVVTRGENNQNSPSRVGSSSQYRGVSWSTTRRKWIAFARSGGKVRNLGAFEDELEAARAAARFRVEHMPFAVEDPALLEQAA